MTTLANTHTNTQMGVSDNGYIVTENRRVKAKLTEPEFCKCNL